MRTPLLIVQVQLLFVIYLFSPVPHFTAFLKDPFADTPYLKNTKARTDLLPPALDAAGIPGFPYTRFYEIARAMKPEEIHPEVIEKLDRIMEAFGL
jgi:hypothetical protein